MRGDLDHNVDVLGEARAGRGGVRDEQVDDGSADEHDLVPKVPQRSGRSHQHLDVAGHRLRFSRSIRSRRSVATFRSLAVPPRMASTSATASYIFGSARMALTTACDA